MTPWHLYMEYIANYISSGAFILREKISSLGIRAVFDRFLTKKAITKVWLIRSLPVDFNYNLTHFIRDEMFKVFPEVKTTLYFYSIPTEIRTESETFKRMFGRARERYERYKDLYENLNENDKLTGKKFYIGGGKTFTLRKSDIEKLKSRYDSFSYVYEHKSNGGRFFKTYVFIQASADDNSLLQRYRKHLHDLLVGRDIFFQEIKGNVSKYLSNFGPASYINEEVKEYPHNLFSDENLAHIIPTHTRGLIGGQGVLFGLDVLSKFPVILNPIETSAAQVFLWIGKSGSGKTFAAQMATLGFLSDELFHASAVCIKGGEWDKLRPLVGNIMLVISMDDTHGNFVNVMRIDDMDVDEDNCEYVYNLAVHATVQLFSIAVNLTKEEGNLSDLEFILDTAVRKVYSQLNGFNYKNPKTFHLTKQLKYEDVVDTLVELSETTQSLSDAQRKMIPLIVTRASTYFKGHGRFSKSLRNEITVKEVYNSRLVVFSMNKNAGDIMDTSDDIKVYMAQHLIRKKHHMRGRHKLHSIEVYDEGQRADDIGTRMGGHSSQLIKGISHAVSGSRSDNVTIHIITNSMASLKGDDKAAIRSNITSVVAGKMNKEDIDELVENYGCSDIKKYMESISNDENPKLENCFALKFDNGRRVLRTIYKAVVPPYIEEELRQRDVASVILEEA